MRALLVLLGVVVVALILAGPERASAASLGSLVVVETSNASVIPASEGVDQAEHCAHVPCSNGAHSHSPGACAAHSFVAMSDGWIVPDFDAGASVGLNNERYTGRTLLPPVPPPLT